MTVEDLEATLIDKHAAAALLDSTPRRCTTRTLRRKLPWLRDGRRLLVPLGAVIAYRMQRDGAGG